jgi:hypothetical protein
MTVEDPHAASPARRKRLFDHAPIMPGAPCFVVTDAAGRRNQCRSMR